MLGDIRELIETVAVVEPCTNAIQLARDVGALGADQAYFLLDRLTESAVNRAIESDATLVDLYAQIDAVKREHGLSEDEDFLLDGHAPLEWLELKLDRLSSGYGGITSRATP